MKESMPCFAVRPAPCAEGLFLFMMAVYLAFPNKSNRDIFTNPQNYFVTAALCIPAVLHIKSPPICFRRALHVSSYSGRMASMISL